MSEIIIRRIAYYTLTVTELSSVGLSNAHSNHTHTIVPSYLYYTKTDP